MYSWAHALTDKTGTRDLRTLLYQPARVGRVRVYLLFSVAPVSTSYTVVLSKVRQGWNNCYFFQNVCVMLCLCDKDVIQQIQLKP